jgi:hypothetical protein
MADMIKVSLQLSDKSFPEVRYIFNELCRFHKIDVQYVAAGEQADLIIGSHSDAGLQVDEDLIQAISGDPVINTQFIKAGGVLRRQSGEPDYLASAFYVLSCAQELHVKKRDQFGRFPYVGSYQQQLGNHDKNLVADYFRIILEQCPLLAKSSGLSKEKSSIFLSHDIDVVYGSIQQDLFSQVKQLNPSGVIKVLQENLVKGPQWLNIQEIIELERVFEFKSTFFWIPVAGKSVLGVANADYRIDNKEIRDSIRLVKDSGWENGLHKSISTLSFEEELALLGNEVIANRYHFLAFDPHVDFLKMEKAGIKFDSSLSFAEVTGFRNGFASPYQPWIFSERRAAKLVECPMHVMDTTYFNYLKVSGEACYDAVVGFMEANKYNSLICILWHNNFISAYKYKEYKETYLRLLEYLELNSFKAVNPSEIVKGFSFY